MKKIKIFLAFLLALTALPLFSETGPYKKDLDRVVDKDGYLNEDDLREVNETYIRAVDAFRFDMPVVLMKSSGQDLDSWCDSFFRENDYGYGSNKNAIVLVIETDTDNVLLKGYGAGGEILTNDEKERLISPMMEQRSQNKPWLLCIWSYLNDVLDLLKANEPIRNKYEDGKLVQEAAPQGKKPYWYPKDVNSFVDFHDENASRVVDDAHIFSDSEIARMKERIKEIQDESGFDLVVFTDTSSYGLSHGVYAADFHQFNGYGFGDDFSGTVLLICMEEGNRGWWTAATGKCQEIYTEKVINKIDDNLEPYMVKGQYGKGVLSYLDDIYRLYKLPSWYPRDTENFVPFRAESKAHCVDQIGLFTREEQAEIERQASEISAKYGTDFVVLTTDETIRYGTMASYARDFIKYCGYGQGENGDACVLCLKVTDGGSWASMVSSISGDGRKCYRKKYLTNVLGHIKRKLLKDKHYEATVKALSLADKMYRTGRVWHEIHFIWPIWFCLLLGLIVASNAVSKVDDKMKAIKFRKEPSRYYVEDSFRLTSSKNTLVKEYSTTQIIEKDDTPSYRSSYSSGSHRSSYSSSYRSSGGRSYSGGGRRF